MSRLACTGQSFCSVLDPGGHYTNETNGIKSLKTRRHVLLLVSFVLIVLESLDGIASGHMRDS